jgi:hypothetical protein
MKTSSRRIFLKTLGAFAAIAPVANLLRASIADAAPTAAPLRLICVNHGLHINEAFFHPRASSGAGASQPGSGTTFSVDFPSSVLLPLLPYQNKLIVVRGVNYQGGMPNHSTMVTSFSGIASGANYDNNACNDSCSVPSSYATSSSTTSGTGVAPAAACSPGTTGICAGGSSIEQYLSSRLAPPGALDPMVMRVGYVAGQTDYISYLNGQPKTPQTSPASIFNAYFGSLVGGGQDAGAEAGPSAATLLYNQRKALFGVTQSDLQSLANRLGPTERVKLDQHLSSLTALTQRLAPAGGTPQGTVGCTPPQGADQKSTGNDVTDFENFVTLVTEAFACDLTRYASFQMFGQRGGFDPSQFIPAWNPPSGSTNPHDCSHNSHGDLNDANAINLALWQNLFYTQMAKLLAALQAIGDPLSPGQTLLDNTMVVMLAEHSLSPCIWNNNEDEQSLQHGFYDIPCVIAGGCAGQFQVGRVFEATPRQGTPDDTGLYKGVNLVNNTVYAGVPHNALLAAVVNACEKQQAAFNPSYQPNLVTQYGYFGPQDSAGPLAL